MLEERGWHSRRNGEVHMTNEERRRYIFGRMDSVGAALLASGSLLAILLLVLSPSNGVPSYLDWPCVVLILSGLLSILASVVERVLFPGPSRHDDPEPLHDWQEDFSFPVNPGVPRCRVCGAVDRQAVCARDHPTDCDRIECRNTACPRAGWENAATV